MMILPFIASSLLLAFSEDYARGETAVNNASMCTNHTRCGNCIAAGCYWCTQQDYLQHRCNVEEELRNSGCSRLFITSSESYLHYHNDTPPRNAEHGLEAVQLAPQNISIGLRPNEQYTFSVTFRQAENYPVDLYFLMDVSKTMKDFKDTLQNMSYILARELRSLTTNYRLGLGTFVDKSTMPYIHHQYQLTEDDDAPFSFKNRQQLTENITEFRDKVSAIGMFANLDLAEGVLDAVMQVIMCTRISSTVQLKTENVDDISVKFRSKCLNSATDREDNMRDTNICEGLRIGDNVTFDVTIETRIPGCPADRKAWTKVFNIYPAGLTEKLTVTVHLDCECPCETAKEYNSTECNQNGTYECGLCACNRDFYGSRCNCSKILDLQNCRKSGGDSTECSGHGRCNCGRCECDTVSESGTDTSKRYTGDLCECNDYTCEYYNGELCGGSANGACKCGRCVCKDGWTGRRCDCSTDVSKCRSKTGSICNNMGNCRCNECHCDVDKTFFGGQTCEDCPTCTSTCEQYSECAKCVQSGKDTCNAACRRLQLVDAVRQGNLLDSNETNCEIPLSNGCIVRFSWNADTVSVQRNAICPPSSDMIWIVLAVIGCIFAVGLMLLCSWKVFVTVHDRREYASLENEVKAQREMITNPLYKDAVTICKNPAFISQNM